MARPAPARPARPRQRRPEARPPEILDAALTVFVRQGYRGTRLDEIAETAGVTKGAVYHHFAGKDDVLIQAVRRRAHALLADVGPALAKQRGPTVVKVRFLLRHVVREVLTPQWATLARLMLGELRIEFPALVHAWIDEGPTRAFALLETLLEEGKASGEFRPELDAPVAARLIVAGLGMQVLLRTHFRLDDPDVLPAERVVDSTIDTWLRGLLARPAAHS